MVNAPEPVQPTSTAARADDPRERLAWRNPWSWVTLCAVFVVGLSFDLWSKYWAFREIAGYPVELERERILGDPSFHLPYHARVVAIPGDLLDFRLVLNHGAVFGIGQHRRELFIVVTLVATIAAVALFARGTRVRMTASHVAIGLILAGGIGNLYDRIVYGAVRDFLHMLPHWELPFGWKWPGTSMGDVFPWVFNVADVMLLAGMAVFVIASWREDKRARLAEERARVSAPSEQAASAK